ncbi:flagellar hook-associated protein 3 [Geobacter sp. FeAm09]|uniref:flagellar hook-associated protein FlgL n=1 Tax=Geobacter sp. FeAm09 TaxID=2597769 RepID=UPI0011EC8141|nr:flagellar hook-associated protein FlgL [Geobacter sp. FeAm09]QEM69861.1 flagellar hook-associated protein 3 [Geobacter sp. FeAm09]
MRITSNMTANNAIYNLQQGRSRLDKLQELSTTEQNINRPSDDPIAARILMDIGDKLKATDQYSSNITKANTFMTVTNTALTGISDFLAQAKSLVNSVSSGSNDATERQTVNDQLVALKKQIIDMANTQSGDQYVFGGADSSTPPFNTANNTYAGDGTQLQIEVAQNSTQAMNLTGDRVLKGTGTSPSYGTTDILQTFDNLIAAVGDSTTPSNVTAIQQGAKDLETGAKQIANAQSDLAARMIRLENMTKMNTSNKNTLEDIASNIQYVDLAKLGVQLTQQQNAFSAALSATAKISQMSLLDYL